MKRLLLIMAGIFLLFRVGMADLEQKPLGDFNLIPELGKMNGEKIASKVAYDMLKNIEKYRATVYPDSGGNATIGDGHLLHKGAPTNADKELNWTEEHAALVLQADVAPVEQALNAAIKVSVTQNQFDALVVWTFNCGIGALLQCSWLKELNKGNYAIVPELMKRWNKIEVNGKLEVCEGLINRREAEATLFKAA